MDLPHRPHAGPEHGSDQDPAPQPTGGETPRYDYDDEFEDQLHVSGLVLPASETAAVEIRRGMTILSKGGEVAGIVAGVIHPKSRPLIDYVLLSRLSQQVEYRMVPVDLIQQVNEETVLLHIVAPLVESLRPWVKQARP